MDVINSARLIIYRMHEKGLEIFLVNTGLVDEDEYWGFPDAVIRQQDVEIGLMKLINLDPVRCGYVYAFAAFLLSDEEKVAQFNNLLLHLKDSGGANAEELLPQCYGYEDLAAMQTDWHEYMLSKEFR